MAHNINAMVYAGATPWHGLGTRLPQNGTWEEIRAAAGFYTAEARDLFLPDGTKVPDRKAIIRADTGQYLATVGRDYGLLQFDELAQAGILASGEVEAIWHTAGTLGSTGARGWLLAELPNPIRVRFDRSEIRKYVLLTASHDGTAAGVLANVATRVVCQNTLGAALREKDGATWTIRHTANAKARLDAAAVAFRKMVANYERLGQLADFLAGQRFSDAQFKKTVHQVLPIPDDEKEHKRLEKQHERLGSLWEMFLGSEGIRGTAWGAWQAWTEYVDHNRYALAAKNAETRMESILLGNGARLKATALESILEELRAPNADLAVAVAA